MADDLDGPWQWGWRGHNGARYAHIARNYLRHGFDHHGGAPLLDAAQADPERPDPYAHHPPGVMWATALVYRATGVGERPARLVSVVATLIGLLLLARLVGRVSDPLAGGVAALLWAASPMTAVYGSHVEVQGPLVLTTGLAVLLAARLWGAGGPPWPWFVAAFAASACDWFGLYFVAGTGLVALWDPLRRRAGLVMCATTGALFLGWLLWLGQLPGMSIGRVLFAAGVRVGGGSGAEQAVLAEYLATWWHDSMTLMPLWPLALLTVAGLLMRPAWGGRGRQLLLLLVVPPLAHALAFPAGLLVHNYWLFALPPALAAGVALALRRVPAAALAVCALALVPPASGLLSGTDVDDEVLVRDEMPSLVGRALATHTEPGDVVLTSYLVNPLRGGDARGDAYVVRLLEVVYYGDRTVRGGITRLEASHPSEPPGLLKALERVPQARWFLHVPVPGEDDAALLAELGRRAVDEPRPLGGEPPVLLFRLSP